MKLPQRLQIRLHFAGLVIDQIAREENHIGFFIVSRIHHLLHEIIAGRKRAEMKVGNLHQTITIKIRWQVGRGKGDVFQFQPLPTLYKAEGKPTHYTQSRNQSKEPRKKCIEQDEDNLRECREKYRGKEYTDGQLVEESHLQPHFGKNKQQRGNPP